MSRATRKGDPVAVERQAAREVVRLYRAEANWGEVSAALERLGKAIDTANAAKVEPVNQ